MSLPMSEHRSTDGCRSVMRAVVRCFLAAGLSGTCFNPLCDSEAQRVVPEAQQISTDVTDQAGITWRQFAGESPDRFLIETMGGGAAFLDFDGDGLLDIFFVNVGETPRAKNGERWGKRGLVRFRPGWPSGPGG